MTYFYRLHFPHFSVPGNENRLWKVIWTKLIATLHLAYCVRSKAVVFEWLLFKGENLKILKSKFFEEFTVTLRQEFTLVTDDAVLHAYSAYSASVLLWIDFTGWKETEWSEAAGPPTWQRATRHCRSHKTSVPEAPLCPIHHTLQTWHLQTTLSFSG